MPVPSRIPFIRPVALFVALVCLRPVPVVQAVRQPFGRVAVVVTPDRPDWTYEPGQPVTFRVDGVRDGHQGSGVTGTRPARTSAPGQPVTFRVDVVRDGHQVSGVTVKYAVGPEMLPTPTQATAIVG